MSPPSTSPAHFAHWPPGLPQHLTLPQTHVYMNLEVSAARYPDKPCTLFYDTPMSYAELKRQVDALAAHLQQVGGVAPGQRVLLYLQNSPQWVVGFYAILRADAVVVPVNPMNRSEELRHLVADSGAVAAIAAQDLVELMLPLMCSPMPPHGDAGPRAPGLHHVVVVTYSDALQQPATLPIPEFVAQARRRFEQPGVVAWCDAIAADRRPGRLSAGPDDLCVMPYTSGTTGQPKGCMHTHRSTMSTLVGGVNWFGRNQDAVYLSVLPFFHVTGLAGSMNGPIYLGATLVILPRWDRDAAMACIERHRVTVLQVISTMLIDFLANPALDATRLRSLQGIRGGGAAMPAAVVDKLKALTGLDYVEGYGMSETMAATHINPVHRPKAQCLGIPVFDVDARVIDPTTLDEVPAGEVGEVVVHGPQVMQGYWQQPEATAAAFIERDGKRFLRTGDLARIDAEGYWFMVDRLKRMINAAGFKVWPAEVEALMYHHPAVQEACVIGVPDAHRGETVKALVVLRPEQVGRVSEQALIEWARDHMAAYKRPRQIEFVASLPKSGSGKVQWRELQEHAAATASAATPGLR